MGVAQQAMQKSFFAEWMLMTHRGTMRRVVAVDGIFDARVVSVHTNAKVSGYEKHDARVASAHSDDSSGSHASRLMEFLTLESSMFIPTQRSLATVDGRIDARVASASCSHHGDRPRSPQSQC